ncbi:hypothetical protein GQ53DRAFT_784266 [Thozetella sp. PMI_491]|nr:hypothetical protein GQ53DRAFT_784266 [Thozetella sp. PMI_491]
MDRQAVTEVPAARVVVKPVPRSQAKDTRVYQLEQLRRRYSPKESTLENGDTLLLFKLTPSDPDFPFDLDYLECNLRIPTHYPKRPAQLQVKNSNIPRGFSINIERGWDRLVQERRGATLLSLTNALDKNLEAFLSEEKAETVKLTIFKDTRHMEAEEAAITETTAPSKPAVVRKPYVPEPSFTKDEIADAKARRAQETKQLEARMGRLATYHKSSDGIVYTLPLEPKRRAALPVGLQSVQSVQLIIPLLYPLQPLRVLLNDAESKDAEGVEELFTKKATEQRQMALTSHINYLSTNLHVLAKEAQKLAKALDAEQPAEEATNLEVAVTHAMHSVALNEDRGHIHTIPRPPEWAFGHESGSSDEDYTDEDDEEGGAAVGALEADKPVMPATQIVEKGTAMSFPSIELHGIELLQVSVLALTVKCERCKTLNDITGLKDNVEKQGSCKKCASAFVIKFRQELVHQNSTRAGFIDASGCTVADLLPSTFVPTCGKCSTASQGGLVSVRGETTTNVCRECHSRFTFKIPEVKFLAYAPSSSVLPPATGPRHRQEKLGLHAGEPLPGRGACEHYKRSYRWFRFSCCSKIHPCDKCHDRAEDHVNEWANRMVCGWCSREQNYSPESCTFCGRSVIGKRGNGYWEGGKGTRNQVLMRKGDKRKYRRIGGGEVKKKEE